MFPQRVLGGSESPLTTAKDDELLIIVGPTSGQQGPAWLNSFVDSTPAIARQDWYYATAHYGQAAQNPRRPVVAFTFARHGDGLEQRYLLSALYKKTAWRIQARRVRVVLTDTSPLSQVMAEDIWHLYHDDVFVTQTKVDYFTWEAPAATSPMDIIRSEEQCRYRQWIDENPDIMTSLAMADELKRFASENDCSFQVLGTEELRAERLNLLLAVGQASTRSPSRLILLTHGLLPGVKPLMLVGKGITFDTGGINLKPFEGFVSMMKNDMGGASLMAALFRGLVRSGYDQPLVLVIPACENLIGEQAMKPGSVVTTRSGRTVMIEHTDAEGRLILSDAITYGEERFAPARTLVAATLTTASLRQHTQFFTPIHFCPADLRASVERASRQYGEKFVFWDEFIPFQEANRGKGSDMTNMGRMASHASMGGGSCVAAHFLKQFAGGELVHIDIFNTVWNWGDDYPGAGHGATGAPFNTLFRALLPH